MLAQRGGNVAGEARRSIEAQTGQPVITSQNAAQLNAVVTGLIESSAAIQPPEQDDDKEAKE